MTALTEKRHRLLLETEKDLVENDLGHLIPVLEQIVQNGPNRQESIHSLCRIWHVKLATARRKYYRGSKALLGFFSPNKIRGEMSILKPACHTCVQ